MKPFKILTKYTNPTENLSRYFRDVTSYSLLAPEDEFELATKAKEGDENAKNRVITSNLRFVISVAKSYSINPSVLEDLISEGNKGVVEALEKYNPVPGFKFISYAVWHIRKNMLDYLAKKKNTIPLPTHVYGQLKKYGRIVEEFNQKLHRDPTMAEFIEYAEKNDIKLMNTTMNIIKHNKPVAVPLELPQSSDENSFAPIDWISSNEFSPEAKVSRDEAKITIHDLIDSIPHIERKLIKLKFGLTVEGVLTYKEIGDKFEKTPEWARSLTNKGIRRLKARARLKGLKWNDLIS